MSRGRRRYTPPAAKPGRERDGVQPQPTRIWLSGALNIVPGPKGGVRLAAELQGTRSSLWIERSWLTLPLPLDILSADRLEVWRMPDGPTITPEQAVKQFGPSLATALRDVARDLWTPLPSDD